MLAAAGSIAMKSGPEIWVVAKHHLRARSWRVSSKRPSSRTRMRRRPAASRTCRRTPRSHSSRTHDSPTPSRRAAVGTVNNVSSVILLHLLHEMGRASHLPLYDNMVVWGIQGVTATERLQEVGLSVGFVLWPVRTTAIGARLD